MEMMLEMVVMVVEMMVTMMVVVVMTMIVAVETWWIMGRHDFTLLTTSVTCSIQLSSFLFHILLF